jgi:hypothetical protein
MTIVYLPLLFCYAVILDGFGLWLQSLLAFLGGLSLGPRRVGPLGDAFAST